MCICATSACGGKPAPVLLLRVESKAERADHGCEQEAADPSVFGGVEQRGYKLLVGFCPFRIAGEHRRRKKDEAHARKTNLSPCLAHERRGGDQNAAGPKEYFVRAGCGFEHRLEFVDHIGAHVRVGAEHASDLEQDIRKSDRDENEKRVAEKLEILERDDDGYRYCGKQKHLIVGETETEHECGQPKNLVGWLLHPAVGEQKHPHKEEGVERVHLDDCRLRPHHRRERKYERRADAAGEREEEIGRESILPIAIIGLVSGLHHVHAGAAHEHCGAASRKSAGDGGEKRHRPCWRRMTHVRDP